MEVGGEKRKGSYVCQLECASSRIYQLFTSLAHWFWRMDDLW